MEVCALLPVGHGSRLPFTPRRTATDNAGRHTAHSDRSDELAQYTLTPAGFDGVKGTVTNNPDRQHRGRRPAGKVEKGGRTFGALDHRKRSSGTRGYGQLSAML